MTYQYKVVAMDSQKGERTLKEFELNEAEVAKMRARAMKLEKFDVVNIEIIDSNGKVTGYLNPDGESFKAENWV